MAVWSSHLSTNRMRFYFFKQSVLWSCLLHVTSHLGEGCSMSFAPFVFLILWKTCVWNSFGAFSTMGFWRILAEPHSLVNGADKCLSALLGQGRKTADWLKKIPLRACSSAFRWPYADAVGPKEWAIRRSYNRAIMNVGCLAEICRALCWNTLLKGLVYNGIILFCFALEVISVIVLR